MPPRMTPEEQRALPARLQVVWDAITGSSLTVAEVFQLWLKMDHQPVTDYKQTNVFLAFVASLTDKQLVALELTQSQISLLYWVADRFAEHGEKTGEVFVPAVPPMVAQPTVTGAANPIDGRCGVCGHGVHQYVPCNAIMLVPGDGERVPATVLGIIQNCGCPPDGRLG